jgi:hypothetical protein
MRKLLILFFLLLPLTVMAQSNLKAFLRPVPNDLFKVVATTDQDVRVNQRTSLWLPRPAATLTAIQWNWDGTAKTFHATAFQSVGLGIGWQHFVPTSDTDPTPFNNFGFNALMLLGENISGALTFSGLGILNLGVTYNLTIKQFGLLTGVQLKF